MLSVVLGASYSDLRELSRLVGQDPKSMAMSVVFASPIAQYVDDTVVVLFSEEGVGITNIFLHLKRVHSTVNCREFDRGIVQTVWSLK
jgi:hypothetical protein